MTTVVISPFETVNFLEGGGHFWVYMQYVQGLREAGCEVYWFECLPGGQRLPDRSRIGAWLRRLHRYGLEGKVILCVRADRKRREGIDYDYVGATRSEAKALFAGADLLLNFHYAIDSDLLEHFRRTALVDIDPGLLQQWMSTGQLPVAPHDVYYTIGPTVGTPSASFPDCGLDWVQIRPAVCVKLWPYSYDACCETFTTVTGWWSGRWQRETVDGSEVLYDNTRRAAFLAFAELPRLTSQPLEVAAHLAPDDTADQQLMERHGWHMRPSFEVARTPEMYRSYIQGSRGELTCVKPSFVKLQNRWISDRSLCYLASGKPVVMQDTGPIPYLPSGDGIFRFSRLTEAAEALTDVNADYERHCQAAREIAETYFDARKTAERILDVALT
jgi:hypothetical protein